ncbi:MAG: acylase [Trueperaceae bacterium]|nr:acylase [Trueperaceae bacterium]
MRTLLFVLLLLVAVAHAQNDTSSPEILWDTWNVPHIYAEDDVGLAYAFGWAQARSHGDLILRLYAQARGQAAEVLGEELLESDTLAVTAGIPARAQIWYEAQSEAFRDYLDAFADGVNAYAAAHPETIADPLEAVLPVTGADLLAHTQRVVHFTFLANSALGQPVEFWQQQSVGSNAWAVGPERSANGNGMLLGNPHLPWQDLFLFYEAHLNTPEYEFYGATLVGFPVPALGFNSRLGWSHTVNPIDGADLFELTLTEGGYLFDEEERAFDTEEAVIRVLRPDGTLDEVPFLVRRSVHGPVIAQGAGRALALRVAGLDRSGALEQWWEMSRAENFEAFSAALERMQLPMFNVVYADNDGNILYLFNGLVPDRTQGDWYEWAGVVPGDTSQTLWDGYLDYDALPLLLNPESGFVQNANDPPWLATVPYALEPGDFPPYLAPAQPPLGRTLRPLHILQLLNSDDAITLSEMIDYKFSSYSLLAERVLDDLLQAAEGSESEAVRRAAEVLADWDLRFEHDSRGAALFFLWYTTYLQQLSAGVVSAADDLSEVIANTSALELVFERGWSWEAEPFTVPDGLADSDVAVAVLEGVAGQLPSLTGALDVPWGDVVRMRAAELTLPATSTDGIFGVVQVLGPGPMSDDGLFVAGGDTFVFAVEFSDPVRAEAILTYGNATQPGFSRIGDQLARYALDELRPVWLERDDIEANLQRTERLD